MEQTAGLEINLFAQPLPSMKELHALSRAVNSNESNRVKFAQQVEAERGKTSAEANLAVGIGLFMLGKHSEAVEKLHKAKDCLEKLPTWPMRSADARGTARQLIACNARSISGRNL